MTADEYKDAINRLGLSQAAAGRLFLNEGDTRQSGERQSRRWVSGEARIPRAVEIALRLMLRHQVDPSDFMAEKR